MEMDRVHRALTPRKADGLPCDIIAKFHYFCTKEQLLAAAREKDSQIFQGHTYELFADLSQLTISKHWALKPLCSDTKSPINGTFYFQFTSLTKDLNMSAVLLLQSSLQNIQLLECPLNQSNAQNRMVTPFLQTLAGAVGNKSHQGQSKCGSFSSTPTPEDSMD